MKKHRRPADPHREREAARYENPIASRELILQTLAEAGVPLTDAELAERLAIAADEREAFERRLAAMEREAQILRNRKGAILVARKLHLVAGRVEGHPDGYGFLVPDEGEDLYLGPHEMRKVLHGDRVMASRSGVDHRGRTEAKIVEVVERVNSRIVGRLRREHGVLFVQPSERRISQNVHVAAEDSAGARAGQVVVAELSAQPDGHTEPIGRIVEVLGEAADPGIEIEIALRKHDLPFKFSEAAEQLAAKYPEAPREGDLAGR
jgi:ribonuclease R